MPQRLCHPSLLCFLLLLPLLPLSSSSMAINPYYANCSEHLHCGNLTKINITYPFRLHQSPSYCGFPGFELDCSLDKEAQDQLTIKLGNRDYVVHDINTYPRIRIITVVDSYFTASSCPLSFTNTSINSTSFYYSSSDFNLTVYINCSFQTKPNGLTEIPCLPNKSYYKVGFGASTFLQNLNGSCDLTAAIPVNYNSDNTLQGKLDSGFDLTWNNNMDWCLVCENSGGLCGYNVTFPDEQICFCNDTNRLNSCFNSTNKGEKGFITANNKGKKGFIIATSKRSKILIIEAVPVIYNLENEFQETLESGFEFTCNNNLDWFIECEESGGICGYNETFPGDEICYCSDNRFNSCFKCLISFFLVCLLLVCILLYFYKIKSTRLNNFIFWKKNNIAQTIEVFLDTYTYLGPKRYEYSALKKMTKSFSEKLGQGGFGAVFKGKLPDGRLVAVKVLSDTKGNGDEFVNEVASIGRTSHINVVSLLGFCSEGSKRGLIYEFMSNGSLEKYIYSESLKSTLVWDKLYQIAVGIAHGLEYLHRGCSTRIVHFDIKPHNILLDQDFCPKISDFGLAQLCLKQDSIFSAIETRGTIGYIAPEVFYRNFGVVSSKSDVYSYGMMILEMVGVRRTSPSCTLRDSEYYFPEWIYEHYHQIGHMEGLDVTDETIEIAKKMVLVGLWCIQTKPGSRPSMNKVVDMLQSSIDDLEMPPKPYLSSP